MAASNRSGFPQAFVQARTCFHCQARERSEWCELKPAELERVESAKRPGDYASGEPLYREGDPCVGVYCVSAGVVAVEKADAQGNSVILRLVHAGETLGYPDYFRGQVYTTGARALEPAVVCHVPRAVVQDLLQTNPALGLRFLQRMATDLDASDTERLSQVSLPVRTRVAHLLLALRERYGRSAPGGATLLELPMARKDIAALLGTTPESVARALSGLQRDGALEAEGRRVTITSAERLVQELEASA